MNGLAEIRHMNRVKKLVTSSLTCETCGAPEHACTAGPGNIVVFTCGHVIYADGSGGEWVDATPCGNATPDSETESG